MKRFPSDTRYALLIVSAWIVAVLLAGVVLTVIDVANAWVKIKAEERFQALANVLGGGLGALGAYLVFWSERKHERKQNELDRNDLRQAALASFSQTNAHMIAMTLDMVEKRITAGDIFPAVDILDDMRQAGIFKSPEISSHFSPEMARSLRHELQLLEMLRAQIEGLNELAAIIKRDTPGRMYPNFTPADETKVAIQTMPWIVSATASTCASLLGKMEKSNVQFELIGKLHGITDRARQTAQKLAAEKT
jgi:hypothetical protein